jgi:hypothetical protein
MAVDRYHDASTPDPLVDSGMIQVGLAITAASVLITQLTDLPSNMATFLAAGSVVVSGISTIALYFVYYVEWLSRHERHGGASPVTLVSRQQLINITVYAHGGLVGTLVSILVQLLRAMLVGMWAVL